MSGKSTTLQRPGRAYVELVGPETLCEHIKSIHDIIERRAFELFEQDGKIFGRDLEHWYKAEAELIPAAPLTVTESDKALTIKAELHGFRPSEVKVALEPRRLTISGTKQSETQGPKDKTVDEMLKIVELPVEIVPSRSVATMKDGILDLTMPKADQPVATMLEVKAA